MQSHNLKVKFFTKESGVLQDWWKTPSLTDLSKGRRERRNALALAGVGHKTFSLSPLHLQLLVDNVFCPNMFIHKLNICILYTFVPDDRLKSYTFFRHKFLHMYK